MSRYVPLWDLTQSTLYSYSDLLQKIGRQAINRAVFSDKPFSPGLYLEILKTTKPSATIENQGYDT